MKGQDLRGFFYLLNAAVWIQLPSTSPLYCKPCHLPVLTGNNNPHCSTFKKPMINCKDNKTKLWIHWVEATNFSTQNLHYAQLQSHHLACVYGYMCVFMRVVPRLTHTCSSLSPWPRHQSLSPKQSFSLYGHGHCLIPCTVPPQHCLRWNLNTVCYGWKRLFKKYWEKKERPSRDSSGSNAGPAGVDYRHILQENSGWPLIPIPGEMGASYGDGGLRVQGPGEQRGE